MTNSLQILLIALLFLITGVANGQETKVELDLVAGASTPELYHFGIRSHYLPNARLDFNFGSDLNNDDQGREYAITINHAYYPGKVNPKFKRKLWSFNTGFSFLVKKNIEYKTTASYLNLFFAREFPVTKRIFIEPELGISYFLFEHVVNTDNEVLSGDRTPIIPKFGINLILKI